MLSKKIFALALLCMMFPLIACALPGKVQFTVTVTDSIHKVPLALARVELRRGKVLVAGKVTTPAGRADFKDIEEGGYIIIVRFVSYTTFSDSILIDAAHSSMNVALVEQAHQDVLVEGAQETNMPSISAVDLRTGNQVFESETYHPAPSAGITNLIQENVAGAARATTGEVHIRGQHGEFTYYVDGIPIPLGVFGGLNEVVDPRVIDRSTFYTGGFPAEYGGQMAGIIDIQNRVPSGHFHLNAETYGGSYLVSDENAGERVGTFKALNLNGQSLSASDHLEKFGYFISGSRQETDRRIDPPTEYLSHDHGFDYFLYGKFDYLFSATDYMTMNLNWGRTYTEIPFDSVETGQIDDHQLTTNAFQTLSYFHTISEVQDKESDVFVGGYAREGGLEFIPGAINQPHFQFAGDSTSYVLGEDRSFVTIGLRTKYTKRLSHELSFSGGLNISTTDGKEHFSSHDSSGNPGPNISTNYSGSDFGVFAQSEIHPLEWTRLDLGLRYDQHISPDIALQKQVSPRIRWNIFLGEQTTFYAYYGKLFMPTNIEGIRSIAGSSDSLQGTLPEKDDFYEAVLTQNTDFGVSGKLAYFYKLATPGLDDQTVGSSAIKTPVNIEKVKTQGIEIGLSYRNDVIPVSGTLNASIIHAYGLGAITGGFLPIDNISSASDLDHDQRVSLLASINYQPEDWFVNAKANYSSGLTNGNPDNAMFGTSLFDFNTRAHVTPAWILDISGGYSFHLGGRTTLEPSLYITNLFDHSHLIKGAYFSGAAWEERRNVVLKVAVHI
jgi:hypothetical protein